MNAQQKNCIYSRKSFSEVSTDPVGFDLEAFGNNEAFKPYKDIGDSEYDKELHFNIIKKKNIELIKLQGISINLKNTLNKLSCEMQIDNNAVNDLEYKIELMTDMLLKSINQNESLEMSVMNNNRLTYKMNKQIESLKGSRHA